MFPTSLPSYPPFARLTCRVVFVLVTQVWSDVAVGFQCFMGHGANCTQTFFWVRACATHLHRDAVVSLHVLTGVCVCRGFLCVLSRCVSLLVSSQGATFILTFTMNSLAGSVLLKYTSANYSIVATSLITPFSAIFFFVFAQSDSGKVYYGPSFDGRCVHAGDVVTLHDAR